MGRFTVPILRAGINMLQLPAFTIVIRFVSHENGTDPFSGSGCLPGFGGLRSFPASFRQLHHPHSKGPLGKQHPK